MDKINQENKKQMYLKWSKLCRLISSMCFLILLGLYLFIGENTVDIKIFAILVVGYNISQMEVIKLISKDIKYDNKY